MVVNICWSVVLYFVYIQYVSWQKTVAKLVAVTNEGERSEEHYWKVGLCVILLQYIWVLVCLQVTNFVYLIQQWITTFFFFLRV